jgi:DNA-binding LacI/PurR family transcriptional regulator
VARATIRDVARVAGVSDGTVSNTLNHPPLVTPETRERVERAMAEVGYVPNAAARTLRVGRSRSIGLVVLSVGSPFFAEVAIGAEQAAAEAGADVALFDTGLREHDREQRLLRRLTERRLDGLIISWRAWRPANARPPSSAPTTSSRSGSSSGSRSGACASRRTWRWSASTTPTWPARPARSS